MNQLLVYLTENCCGGRPELCAPNAFIPLETLQSSTRAATVLSQLRQEGLARERDPYMTVLDKVPPPYPIWSNENRRSNSTALTIILSKAQNEAAHPPAKRRQPQP
jgi:hypothetical protein